jgi:hypothetical protein
VPSAKRAQLRRLLSTGGLGEIQWRERRQLFASDFHLSGQSDQVTKVHARVSQWLATGRVPDQPR